MEKCSKFSPQGVRFYSLHRRLLEAFGSVRNPQWENMCLFNLGLLMKLNFECCFCKTVRPCDIKKLISKHSMAIFSSHRLGWSADRFSRSIFSKFSTNFGWSQGVKINCAVKKSFLCIFILIQHGLFSSSLETCFHGCKTSAIDICGHQERHEY